jgi:hypothetical protein
MAAAKHISRKPILPVGVGALALRTRGEPDVVTLAGRGIPPPPKATKQHLPEVNAPTRQSLMQDMLTAEAIGSKLNLSSNTINKMRREDRLVGLSAGKRQYRYPKEQIGRHGLLNGLQDVIRACRGDHWQAWEFLRSPAAEIGFGSGFAALEKGASK